MSGTLFDMERQPAQPGGRSVTLASAGTGKTFQLTNQLIAILARGETPESILATTFTRAAAGEILHRLLGRLAAAAQDPAKLGELQRHVGPALSRDDCRGLLVSVARRLHRLNISTLDAFFYQMASSYALELGLGPAWRLMDDPEDAALRLEALETALDAAHKHHGGEELASLFRLLHGGDPGRDVADRLQRAVKDAYEVFLAAPAEAWEQIQPINRKLSDAELAVAIEAIGRMPLPVTRAGKEDRRWAKAVAKLQTCARDGLWEDFACQTLVQRTLEEGLFNSQAIPDDIATAIQPLIHHAEAVIIGRLADRNRATCALLAHFDEAYSALKKSRGRYRFDDLPRLLRGHLREGMLEELYYRLDGRVRHLLLDEFQDTSIPQFHLLRPILDELLSQAPDGRTVYIVGDHKQSLYSWRSAEPRLLRSMSANFEALQELDLHENWRSSQVVLNTVNDVFSGLAANDALAGHVEVASDFAENFPPHTAARDLPGAVNIVGIGPLDRDDDPVAIANDIAADRIAEITAQAPGATVGVLVRTRKRIAPLLEALRQRGIEASEEGGSPLTDTPAAAATIALLLLADHPDHTAAAMRVATTPLGPLVGLADPTDRFARRRAAAAMRQRIERDGYGGAFDWVLREVAGETDARGVARMSQLVALGDQLDGSPPARIADAARALAEMRMGDPREASVRLMTMHASKGLQFDVVVLPDLSDSMAGRSGGTLVDQANPMQPPIGASCNLSSKLRTLHRQLQMLAGRDEQRRVREALCLLYVAMTRAKRRLDMIVKLDRPSTTPRTPTADRVLSAQFPPAPADPGQPPRQPQEPVVIAAARQGDWSAGLAAAAEVAPPVPLAVELKVGVRPPWRLARRSPSRREDSVARALRPATGAAAGGVMEAGRLTHLWLERIGWLEDGLPADSELLALASARGWAPAVAAERLAVLHQSLAAPAIGDLLSRKATAARACAVVEGASGAGGELALELRREWPFALRDEDALVTGQIDRLIIARREGRPVWAEVIDFKTDVITRQAPDQAALLARHAEQMQAYRTATARALRLPPAQVTCHLALLALGAAAQA